MSATTSTARWHVWIVGVFALLFNAVGVFDFTMYRLQGSQYLASAGMTPEQIAYYATMPFWAHVVWAVGVFTAFVGSILLLMRRKAAMPVFGVSLAAFLLNLLHTYVLTNGGDIMGQQMAITSAVIAVLLVLFCVYARSMSVRGAFH